MIWATWRQHRASLIAALSVIGLLIAAVVVSTLILRPTGAVQFLGGYSVCYESGSAACKAETVLDFTTLFSTVLPLLLGVFVGVTVFARDIARGTHVLGLSQSVSRGRWFWSKLLVVFVPVVVAATALGAALQWSRGFTFWARNGSVLDFPTFQSSALLLGATTAFALALGAAIALLLRRSLASMALTVVVAGAVLVSLGAFARPHYATPDIDAQSLDNGMPYYSFGTTSDNQRIWTVSSGYVDAAGRGITIDRGSCQIYQEDQDYPEAAPEETTAAFEARSKAWHDAHTATEVECLRAQGADHYQIKYHPESRFWRFQVTESAILLLLAGALLIPARWGLRRLRP
ncbi:ABC transporter permease [Tomitella biformata]|uniref:ABC transporter permease n=1 Tax=Tomitella biformata TaxID=630403 RepID=UPI00046744F1|nr:ABC transporter permease [Tomitella biformata]